MSNISRRSFLKLVGAAAPAILFPAATTWAEKHLNQGDSSKPNVIILLFDAMSARDLSLYGYPRPTSPRYITPIIPVEITPSLGLLPC